MTKPIPIIVAILLSALFGCGGTPSPASRLPANHEIDAWTLAGPPTVLGSDAALYAQYDGGGSKYIDRGWKSGVYATYQQDGSTIFVAVHDMGTPDNAQSIFNYNLPISRVQINNLPSAVVDPTAYMAMAFAGQYYIEVSIDDRSAAALDDVQRFVVAIMNRC
jgi:hypothetical protein